ncbi:hypothetical protein OHO28_28290 [Streptomyces europaeiscabiei]|uniref:hypothetical protein n=1 Tax=Streptomyces europaeiscabiei TaxID=146819 RepID=UPI002E193DC9
MSELQEADRPPVPELEAPRPWEAGETGAPAEPKAADSSTAVKGSRTGEGFLEPTEPEKPTESAEPQEPAEPDEVPLEPEELERPEGSVDSAEAWGAGEPEEPLESSYWSAESDTDSPQTAEEPEGAEGAEGAHGSWRSAESGEQDGEGGTDSLESEEPVEPEESSEPAESEESDAEEGEASPQLEEQSADSVEAPDSPQSAEAAEPTQPTEVAQPVESGEPDESVKPGDSGDKIQKTVDRPPIENMYFDDGEEIEGLTYGDPINERPEGKVPLFDGPPTREQTAQGSLNDCGVIASLGAVAGHRPEAIENAVQENPDGTYTVTLHDTERGADGICRATDQRIELLVEPDLPVVEDDPHTPVFAQMEGTAWAAVLEKAMAAVDQTWDDKRTNDWDAEWKADTDVPNGPAPVGYERLNQGSSVWEQTEILTQLTGRDSIVYPFPQGEGAGPALEGHLQQQLADNKPILAASRMLNEDADEEELPYELVPNHAYEVVGAQDGMVHLRNPWGVDDPEEMSTEEFIRNFSDQGWGLYGTLT